MNEKIFTSFPMWPEFEKDEIQAVVQVLLSGKVNYWTGEEGRLFEQEFAEFIGAKHAIALANGTVALEGALFALGIGPGDEVIVPSKTFIATASCVVMRGAKPVPADIDLESQNITAKTIEAVLSKKTRAVIVVHLGGLPCDMDPILRLAKRKNLKVIEDCAQALGATYKGKMVGTFGHAGAFSFCQDKIMTTGGEGGMLVFEDSRLWKKVWSMKDHGKSYEAVFKREHPPGFPLLCETFGTNWRMTEVQAALGRIALKKVPRWIQKRRANSAFLSKELAKIPGLRLLKEDPEFGNACYKFFAFVKPEMLKPGWDRNRILDRLNSAGIPCFYGGCSEIYREKAFIKAGFQPAKRHPNAKLIGETCLMFLVHPTLTTSHLTRITEEITRVFQGALADLR